MSIQNELEARTSVRLRSEVLIETTLMRMNELCCVTSVL